MRGTLEVALEAYPHPRRPKQLRFSDVVVLLVSDQDAFLRDASEECGTPFSSEHIPEVRRSRNGDPEPRTFEMCPVPSLW